MSESKLVVDPRALAEVAEHPFPLLFVTVSGAHLYGFASPDSDWDLRGVHALPLEDVLGLEEGRETVEVSKIRDGCEVDLVTHDVKKFFLMLLRRNGYVLEQLCSPLVVRTSPEHAEAKALVPGLLTKHHAHHYLGFARTQWGLFARWAAGASERPAASAHGSHSSPVPRCSKQRDEARGGGTHEETPPRVKPLLYVYRVLLTGLHLMRAGEVEANLERLISLGDARLPQVPDLLARKRSGPEKGTLEAADLAFHEAEVRRLSAALEEAMTNTSLPDAPRPEARAALNDLLVRVRLGK